MVSVTSEAFALWSELVDCEDIRHRDYSVYFTEDNPITQKPGVTVDPGPWEHL